MRHLVSLSAFMILGCASAAGAAPAAVVQSPNSKATATGERCQRADIILAQPLETPGSKRLGELPPGNVVLTVFRQENGCHKPVIVRYGIGSNPAPAPRRHQLPRPLRP